MEKHRFDEIEFSCMEASRIPFAVYQFIDKRVVTLALSAGFLDLFELDRAEAYELMDNDMYRAAHPDDIARIADAAFRFATQETPYNVVYRTKVSGGYRIIHAIGEHVFAEDGARLAYVWYTDEGLGSKGGDQFERDINKALDGMVRESSLYQMHVYDRLTGLPNMTYFFDLAEAGKARLIEEGKQPIFMYFNLNGMKHFNHRYGFSEGDKLIAATARILANRFGTENCSRFAKDHFAVLTNDENVEDTLQDLFEECKAINGGANLPIQVGIFTDQSPDLDVGSACDRAQYACNLNGDAYLSEYRYFDDSMLDEIRDKRYAIENIDKAIEEQWIQVYFQAIVRAANGKVCDEEALARWIDPERGMLSPDKFIPALEDAKLIYKLDLYVIDCVLAKMKRQADAGVYVVPQSVNLSRADFDTVDIVEEIRQRVDAAGIPHDKLNIEITESIVGSDFEFMKKQIKRFQDLGFHVWMDDFGSGYSSLDVLQSIHFDMIKLDMHFLRGFDESDESKIILTELARMAIGLGIDTVAEGVETEEQVEFLKEIGCSRLQGFYYTKPVPIDEIFSRAERGIQIGFENPDETDYYATIGKVNLYDMSVIAKDDDQSFRRYFDTIPMAIYELSDEGYHIVRSNKSYREFVKRVFGIEMVKSEVFMPLNDEAVETPFTEALQKCGKNGGMMVVDEEVGNNETTHSILRRIAVNPVTGTCAVVVAVLAVVDSEDHRAAVTYSSIARSLSSDYSYLYYVNLKTGDYIEYSSNDKSGNLSLERRGKNFFETSRGQARILLYGPDQDSFIADFTQENVVRQMDEQGAFIRKYRQVFDDQPRHMLMKAVRMDEDTSHIIVGISDVDLQARERAAYERIRSDQVAYTRINALSDDYLCIYIVDLATNQFEEYTSSGAYEGLGIAKKGDDFFAQSRRDCKTALHEDDCERFASLFTKENVLGTINREGCFKVEYRLLIDGDYIPVKMKAVIVEEQDGPRLIIGVR